MYECMYVMYVCNVCMYVFSFKIDIDTDNDIAMMETQGVNLPAESSKNGIARWQRAGCSSTERGAAFNDRLIAFDEILISR